MLTRRERLIATLRGEPVDRPAVNFYEIGGFKVNVADPDPYNVYSAPDWQPLLELAEQRTDIIRMMSAVRARSFDPTESCGGETRREFFTEETWEEGHFRLTRTTVVISGHRMTQVTRRDRDLDTIWTTEHLLKNTDDLRAYLQIPDDAFLESIDVAPLEAEEVELGDKGIVMVDTEDPLCAAATLFSMEDYTIIALTEPALFHRLLEKLARPIHTPHRAGQPVAAWPTVADLRAGIRNAPLPAAPFVRRICRPLCGPHGSNDSGTRRVCADSLTRPVARRAEPHRDDGAGCIGSHRTTSAGRCAVKLRARSVTANSSSCLGTLKSRTWKICQPSDLRRKSSVPCTKEPPVRDVDSC